jgi:hypothetical protein
MSKAILTVGDKIVDSGSLGDLMVKYFKHLEEYKNNKRPSKEPGIWVLTISPDINK